MVELGARRFHLRCRHLSARTGRFTSQLYGGGVLPIPYDRRGGRRIDDTHTQSRLLCRFCLSSLCVYCSVYDRIYKILSDTIPSEEFDGRPGLEEIKRESFFFNYRRMTV